MRPNFPRDDSPGAARSRPSASRTRRSTRATEPWSRAEHARARARGDAEVDRAARRTRAGCCRSTRQAEARSPSSARSRTRCCSTGTAGTPPYTVSPLEGLERAAVPGQPPAPSSIGVNWVARHERRRGRAGEGGRRRDRRCRQPPGRQRRARQMVDSPSYGKEAVDRKAITLRGRRSSIAEVYEANPRRWSC